MAFVVSKHSMVRPHISAWLVMTVGALFIFISFIWDYSSMVFKKGLITDLNGMRESQAFMEAVSNHVPATFIWPVYLIGEILLIASAVLFYRTANAPGLDD